MKTQVIIEKGKDGTYGAYLANHDLPFGVIGDGETIKETVEDFFNSYAEMREYYKEIDKPFVETEFEFRYDVPSFLAYYGNLLSLAGLERLTGVHQDRLSHYVTGRKKPRPQTVRKIEEKLHAFGRELSEIELAR